MAWVIKTQTCIWVWQRWQFFLAFQSSVLINKAHRHGKLYLMVSWDFHLQITFCKSSFACPQFPGKRIFIWKKNWNISHDMAKQVRYPNFTIRSALVDRSWIDFQLFAQKIWLFYYQKKMFTLILFSTRSNCKKTACVHRLGNQTLGLKRGWNKR